MNYLNLYASYPEPTIVAAWDTQLAEAAQTPWFKEILLRRGMELFPHFAACYAELRALPRGARHALQRQIARSSEPAAIFPEWLQSGGTRELQYKLARSLAGAALLLALWQGMASAATITVTTKNSRVRPDGQCSLIEAIVNANADAAFFSDCPAGSGPDTIVLPAKGNVSVKAQYDDTYGPTGLPLITSPITIQGNGGGIRGQGNAFRLLAVSNSGNLTLQNVNLSRGSSSYGGGLFNNGTLTIQDSTISGNTAGRGGGVSNHGTLTVENSTISGNKASDDGGGIFNASNYNNAPAGDLSLLDTTVSENRAKDSGGGLFNEGSLNMSNTIISDNRARFGPDIFP